MASGHQPEPHPKAGQMAAPTSTASPSKNPLPTGSRPQMAISRHPDGHAGTSALPPKADQIGYSWGCPLLTQRRHLRPLVRRLDFRSGGYKEGPIPPVCLFRLDSVQRPAKSMRAREGGRPKTRLNAWENDGVSANPTAAAVSAIPRRLYRKRVRARSSRRRVPKAVSTRDMVRV